MKNSDRDRRAAGLKSAERFVCVSVYPLFEAPLEPYIGGASVRESYKNTRKSMIFPDFRVENGNFLSYVSTVHKNI